MDLIRLYVDFSKQKFGLDVSLYVALVVLLLIWIVIRNKKCLKRFNLVKLNIDLGGIGKAEFSPNIQDVQIAHQIWTELVTRKAAIAIDPEHDVIIEIYDSWYNLFTKVRDLIASIPAELVRNEESTREIIRISTATLNEGLRPHLTKWQARFRNWYTSKEDELKTRFPQEVQKDFPGYQEMIDDMLRINSQLMQYADELKKIIYS